MEHNVSSGASSKSAATPAVKRRIWSAREEAVLILALKEIAEGGWKCENSFRTGYCGQLEKVIRRHMPQTDLRADPHIQNKMHIWKKNHGSISTMLSRSGFEWSDKNCVVFDDESIREEYVKTDTHAKGMKNKSYPLYKDWCEIFGKDRATGEHAEDFVAADAVQIELGDDHNEVEEPIEVTMGENEINSPADESGKSSGKTNNKRKCAVDADSGDKMVELLGKFCAETLKNLQCIADRIGYEVRMSEKRAKLYDTLGALGMLTIDQQILAAKLLAKDNKDLDLFFSLPPEAQARMVGMMVSGRI